MRQQKKALTGRTAAKQAAPLPSKGVVRRKAVVAPVVVGGSSKKDAVLSLVRRECGASLAELVAATAWQAHSVRGFLSGTLRKKLGLVVRLVTNEEGTRVYRVE